jgi:hypothetical protein
MRIPGTLAYFAPMVPVAPLPIPIMLMITFMPMLVITLPLLCLPASLLLYLILGFPGPLNRDPVSWEKSENLFTHDRKNFGWWIDSRRLSVSLPEYKRLQLITLLTDSLEATDFTLLEISELIGHLGTATLACRCMRPAYFLIMVWLRQLLTQRYHAVLYYKSRHRQQAEFTRLLPSTMYYRLSSLVSGDVAQVLWNWRTKHRPTAVIRRELARLKFSLETEPWEIFIPQMVPQYPNYESAGVAGRSLLISYICFAIWARGSWLLSCSRPLPRITCTLMFLNVWSF